MLSKKNCRRLTATMFPSKRQVFSSVFHLSFFSLPPCKVRIAKIYGHLSVWRARPWNFSKDKSSLRRLEGVVLGGTGPGGSLSRLATRALSIFPCRHLHQKVREPPNPPSHPPEIRLFAKFANPTPTPLERSVYIVFSQKSSVE